MKNRKLEPADRDNFRFLIWFCRDQDRFRGLPEWQQWFDRMNDKLR